MADANCTWDEVTGVDGYNVYLKGLDFGVLFNGVDQYANLGTLSDFGSLHLSACTIDVDFKLNNDGHVMFLCGASNGGFGSGLEVRINADANSNYDAGRVRIQYRDALDDGQNILVTTQSTPINDGTRHTLSIRVDGDNEVFKVYVDGQEYALTEFETETWDSDENFVNPWSLAVRRAELSRGNIFDGVIYQHRIWSDIIPESQILNTAGVYLSSDDWANDYPNLFRYYKCNSGTGDQMIEEIAEDHGTLVGNDNDDMWPQTVDSDFVKQNDSLIPTPEFTINDLVNGVYEAYVTSQLSSLESAPSNIVEFNVGEIDAIADAGNWAGNSVFSHEGDYIQYTAPGSSGTRRYTYSGEPDLTDIEVLIEVFEQGDADNNDPSWGIRIGQILEVQYGYGFSDNGDRLFFNFDGSQDSVINTGLNAGTDEVVSLKVKFQAGSLFYKVWLRDSQSEPDYTGYGAVSNIEAGKFGLTSAYGFADWRCIKYEYTVL